MDDGKQSWANVPPKSEPREIAEALVLACGVTFDYVYMKSMKDISVHGITKVTFAQMKSLSEAFKTKQIEVTCDDVGECDLTIYGL